jgi:ABC-type uncharacterized transport system substrate-binding protein
VTFIEELKRLGYVEGKNLIIDRYSAEGRTDRYDDLAREVVSTNPDLISCSGSPMARSFKAATSTIPIVTITGDPIRQGIVSSIARPGGNITGVSVGAGFEIWGKRLELLVEAVPKISRVAFISSRRIGSMNALYWPALHARHSHRPSSMVWRAYKFGMTQAKYVRAHAHSNRRSLS